MDGPAVSFVLLRPLVGFCPQLPGMHLVPEHPRGQGQT